MTLLGLKVSAYAIGIIHPIEALQLILCASRLFKNKNLSQYLAINFSL